MVIKNDRKARSDIIFCDSAGLPRNVAQLAKKAKIPAPTLYKWRANPDMINAAGLRLLFKAVRASDEDIIRFFS